MSRRATVLVLVLAACLLFATFGWASPQKQLTFGMVVPVLSHGWQVINKGFAEEAAKELGVKLIVFDGQGDDQKQINDLQTLIEQKVDGLLLDPNTSAPGAKMVEMINAAGIPAVFYDREPDAKVGGQYISFVGPDSVEAGQEIAEFLLSHGARKLIEIDGLLGSAPAADRAQGLANALKKYPDAQVLGKLPGDWEMEKGMSAGEDLLTAHPDADAIWAASDVMGIGALQAAQKRGLNNILVASIDCDPVAAKMIQQGSQLKETVGAHYICAALSAVIMYDYLHGKQVPPRVEFKMLRVGTDNVDKFLKIMDQGLLLKGRIRGLSLTYTPNAPADRFNRVLDISGIKVK